VRARRVARQKFFASDVEPGGFSDRRTRLGWVPAGVQRVRERARRPSVVQPTKHLTPRQAHKAYGARLREFARARAARDPDGRLLSAYFAELLEGAKEVP
jgi:hypothetical protein